MAGKAGGAGRGLFVVNVLADPYGYDLLGPERAPWGKRVWARLAAKGEPG
ncbi:hypothetical protein ACIREE_38845 [Streptomyces sp. NPDC102467]